MLMKKLKPSEILKCMDFCGNALTCTTDNHACAYGDEGCIDCVDRLEADIQALIDAGDNLILLPAAPENKPLTLDQLRQMDGEPVYCIYPSCSTGGEWFINEPFFKSCRKEGYALSYQWYGEWKAYARKPEQEAKK